MTRRGAPFVAPFVAPFAAALPLIVPAFVIAVRRPVIAWSDDLALTELAVREAARFHQLLGMGGRFGWRHPGPLWLQILVPFYELSGRAPWSLSVGALGLAVACVAVAVVVMGRWAPILAAGVAVYLARTGLFLWTNPWAGYAFTWPFLPLIALGAVGATWADADWAVPAMMLTGTLLVQTDASTAVAVFVVGAVAISLRLARHRLAGRLRPPAIALLVATALAWVPPLVEWHNLTLLGSYALHSTGHHPLRAALAATGAALSVLPAGTGWLIDQTVRHPHTSGSWPAVAATLGFIAANATVALLAYRSGRRLAGDLAVLTLAATAAAVLSMGRVDGQINFYLVIWVTILPVPGLAAAVMAFAPATDTTTVAALAVAAVFALYVVVAHGATHNWNRAESAQAVAITDRVDATLGPAARGLVLVHVVSVDTWPQAAAAALRLERAGAHIEVDRRWVFLFGDAFAPRAAVPTAELWFARLHERPAVSTRAGVVELGVVGGVDVLALKR